MLCRLFSSCGEKGLFSSSATQASHSERLSDSEAVMSALRCAEKNPIEMLYSFALSKEAEAEFERVVTDLRKKFMEHTFKSESFILSV